MSIRFNANEILVMAEEIEQNGAAFYRKAAEGQASHAPFLRKLAAMEDRHVATFAAMRKALPAEMKDAATHDPYLEATLYLNAMADHHGGEGSPSVAARLTGRESMEQILRMAIRLEEKSVLFYLGLKELVPANLGRDQVDAIIAEEKGHMVTLAAEMKKIAPKA